MPNLLFFKKNNKLLISSLATFSTLICLLLAVALANNVLQTRPGITDFSEHIMSEATLKNIDISERINHYYLYIFAVLSLGLLSFVTLYTVFTRSPILRKNLKLLMFIQYTSLIGIIAGIGSLLSYQNDSALYFVTGVILTSIISVTIERKSIFCISKLFGAFCLSVSISVYIWSVTGDEVISYFSVSNGNVGVFRQFYFVILWMIFSIAIYYIIHKLSSYLIDKKSYSTQHASQVTYMAGMPLLVSPIIQSVLLEISNVLNKRFDIVIAYPGWMYTLVFICSVILAFSLCLGRSLVTINIQKRNIINYIYFPVTLSIFSFIIAQPLKVIGVGNEYFEMANHGLSVDHLFRYGSIPIVETFDAHMLSQQIYAYVYSFFNGYEPWAAFLYNSYYFVIYILFVYYLLGLLMPKPYAFLFILTFPLLAGLFNEYVFSGIMILGICNYFRLENYKKRSYLFWLFLVVLCLYKLDIGVAAVAAGVITVVFILILHNRVKELWKFVLTGIASGIMAVLVFVLLCIIKGISPQKRLLELLSLIHSNQNWAYSIVGDPEAVAYIVSYFILPLLLISLLIIAVVRYWKNKKSILMLQTSDWNIFIVAFYFSIFYFFNLSRGIVRHSLAEGTLMFTMSTFALAFLALMIFFVKKKFRFKVFLGAVIITFLITNINLNTLGGFSSVLMKSASASNYLNQYTEIKKFNGTRVEGELPDDAKRLKEILDTTLEKNETYFDFASVNYFYALVGRKNPVYANQSPLLINGDSSQEFALQGLKEIRPRYVLMPINGKDWSTIDGVAVDYKYYKISEYINMYYSPLIRLGQFDIYCLTDERQDIIMKLQRRGLIEEDLYSQKLNDIDLKALQSQQVEISQTLRGLVLKSDGIDPQVSGFLNNNELTKFSEKDKPTRVNISYESSAQGMVQVFFTLTKSEDFSEVQSQTFEVSQGQSGNLVLKTPSVPAKIRIDTNVQSITLTNLRVSQGLQIIDNQPETLKRNLGSIPLLWAQQDEVYDSAPLLDVPITNANLTATLSNEIRKRPMNLTISMISPENTTSTLELLNLKGETLGSFSFDTLSGQHNYVILLSVDYNWWTEEELKLAVKTNGAVKITKLSYYDPVKRTFLRVLN